MFDHCTLNRSHIDLPLSVFMSLKTASLTKRETHYTSSLYRDLPYYRRVFAEPQQKPRYDQRTDRAAAEELSRRHKSDLGAVRALR
jgi:hypothetical protein